MTKGRAAQPHTGGIPYSLQTAAQSTSKFPFPMGDSGPASNTWLLRPTQTASRSVQPFCRAQDRDRPTERPSDRQRDRHTDRLR